MVPPFDLQGGLPLALARGLSVAALLSAFGTIVFRTLVVPRAFPRLPPDLVPEAKRQLWLLAQSSIAAAILGTIVWLCLQSAQIADAGSIGAAIAAIPKIVSKTMFGHVVVLQLLALMTLAMIVGRADSTVRMRAAALIATIAVALQAGHSHAFSMVEGASLLLAFDILHLLGAGAWLGGLIPLLLMVRLAPPKSGAAFARWFSPLGQWCVAALLVSAAYQAWVLVATIPGVIGTAYGWMVMVKLALFALLLGFAWSNRYRFAPALLHDRAGARAMLIRSITLQTGAALAILAAAAILSELPPSMHLQALWPFTERFSLATIQEDADFRREVIEAAAAVGVGVVLVVAALVLRRFRVPAAIIAAVIAWFAIPHFDLLLVTAYPTSFFHSTAKFTSAAIVDGSMLFAENCTGCHGAGGHGNGPLAKTLPVPPADLTAAHLWMHSDGELFWWLSHGIENPEGGLAMPGFAPSLDEDARWDLIDYIRAHNAGLTVRAGGIWARTIPAPGFAAICDGGQTKPLASFKGAPLILVVNATPPAIGTVAVVAASNRAQPSKGVCVARDLQIGRAYAIAAGLPGDADGATFLIDASGLLRRVWPAGHAPNGRMLAAALTDTRDHPAATALQAAAGMRMDGMDMGGMKMGGMAMTDMKMAPAAAPPATRPAPAPDPMGGMTKPPAPQDPTMGGMKM